MELTTHDSEKELLRQIAQGDKDAFEQLYRHYRNKAYSIAYSYISIPVEVEDILQECFLKLWDKRETLKEIEHFDQYLFIMLRNMLVSAMRKKDTQQKIKLQTQQLASLEQPSFSMAEEAEAAELRKIVHRFIGQLTDRQQRIYRLNREAGLSHAEIAELLQISPRTVSNTISLVLSGLKHELEEKGYLTSTITAALIIFF